MGRLIDSDQVYNAIQITSDKFGVASQIVGRSMYIMLGQIPTANAICIPENATNGDVLMATGLVEIVENLSNDMLVCVSINGLTRPAFVSFSRAWWDAPYESGVN